MTAMAGASGLRAWLQQQAWLSPRLLRRLTIAAFVAATLVSTVGLSGSSKAAPAPHAPAPHAAH